MPFNLLLIPLVAGYLFLTEAYLFAYSTSLLQKEQLLLRVSIVGLALAMGSRLICLLLVQSRWGVLAESVLYNLAPFPFMGTALGTLPLGYVFWKGVNFLVPANVAGDWLYHADRLNQLESLLMRSAMGIAPHTTIKKPRLLWIQLKRILSTFNSGVRSSPTSLKRRLLRIATRIRRVRRRSIFTFGKPHPLMLTMSDNKVYVGFVSELPPVTGDGLQYIRVLPLWSGYRASDTKEVSRVTSYIEAVRRVRDASTLLKVIRCTEISSANLFEDDLFDIPVNPKKPRIGTTRRRLVRPRKPIGQ